MKYQTMPPIDKDDAIQIFAKGVPEEIQETLVRVALHESDWQWAQAQCLAFLEQPNFEIRRVAIICFGHLARIHRTLDLDVVLPSLQQMREYPSLIGTVDDAMSDIEMFIVMK